MRVIAALRSRWAAFRNQHGRRWAVVLIVLLGAFVLDRWQDIDFVVSHQSAIANGAARAGNVVMSDWFLVPAFIVTAALLVWIHAADQKAIHKLETASDATPVGVGHVTGAAASLAGQGSVFKAKAEINNEGTWLTLERPSAEPALFRVGVTDPLGGGASKEFGQAGRLIQLRYPKDFLFEPSESPPQPWGSYDVAWEVFTLSDDENQIRPVGTTGTSFELDERRVGWTARCEVTSAQLYMGTGVRLSIESDGEGAAGLRCTVIRESTGYRWTSRLSAFFSGNEREPVTQGEAFFPSGFTDSSDAAAPNPPEPGSYVAIWTGDVGEFFEADQRELDRSRFSFDALGRPSCL